MLCLDDHTVCKPIVEREQHFYETLPESLKTFTPKYYGIIKVHLIEDEDYIMLAATLPNQYTPHSSSGFKSLRFRRSGSIETEWLDAMFDEDQTLNGIQKYNSATTMNPWVLKCHKEYLGSILEQIGTEKWHNFLVLENLTFKFTLPCILDVKMGTRQYGDTDSLAKRQSKMVKVVTTTSGKLGVRIGGMQVYQATTGHFLCRNKFYGRSLTASSFQAALRNFLHDGARLRVDILPPLIRQLEALASTVAQLESVRLYTASLLLLYEGEKLPYNKAQPQRSLSERLVEPERGAEIYRSNSAERLSERSSRSPSDNFPSNDEFRRRSTSCSKSKQTKDKCIKGDVSEKEPLTDVRLIDFAHATHCGMDDTIVYAGPDSGFLFGLENMIDILKDIHSDCL